MMCRSQSVGWRKRGGGVVRGGGGGVVRGGRVERAHRWLAGVRGYRAGGGVRGYTAGFHKSARVMPAKFKLNKETLDRELENFMRAR